MMRIDHLQVASPYVAISFDEKQPATRQALFVVLRRQTLGILNKRMRQQITLEGEDAGKRFYCGVVSHVYESLRLSPFPTSERAPQTPSWHELARASSIRALTACFRSIGPAIR